MEPLYIKTTLDEVITVEKLVTIHYFEYAKDYVFNGERHDFWEFLYVDKGEVEIMAGSDGYNLEQGDIVFHKPNEFHSVWANGKIAPNLIVISFECSSNEISYFENKILKLPSETKYLLGEIIKEAKNTFTNDLGGPYNKLTKKSSLNLGSEQLIKLYLEMFLIQLIRKSTSNIIGDRVSFSAKYRMEEDLVNNIIDFMKDNIKSNLSFDDICVKFSLGKTHLKTMFKKKTKLGVVSYFRILKIDEAKKIIREGTNNFTEIADILGYDSVHYFSRSFKKITGMSPSEYSKSIKAYSEL